MKNIWIRHKNYVLNYISTVIDAKLYSSPMIRALETGEIATGRSKADFILDSRIRERSFGKWDGKYREDLDARCRELGAKDIFGLKEEGMETDGETQARVKAFFDDLVKDLRPDDKNICIFAHGGLIRQFLMHLKSRNAVIPDQVF